MLNNFYTSGNGNSSVGESIGRRRRRRVVVGDGRGSATSWSLESTAGSSVSVVTSQPQPTSPSRSETLIAGALGAAALGTTVVAGALATTAPTTIAGALSSAVTGSLGADNATNEAIISAVTSAGAATTIDVPNPSDSNICKYLTAGALALMGGCALVAAYELYGHYCSGNRGGSGAQLPPVRFYIVDKTDSGYFSFQSDLGGSRRSFDVSLDGDSLDFRGSGGEGPSAHLNFGDEGPSESVGVSGGGVDLDEVVIAQPMCGGGFPPEYLNPEIFFRSSCSGSESSLFGSVGGDGDSDKGSVREALLGSKDDDPNRGPDGKCKRKLHNIER